MNKNFNISGWIWKEKFSFGKGFGRNVIIFGVDMSSSVHVNNKKKYILILGEGPTQGLDWLQKNCIQSALLKTIKNFVWICIMMEQTVVYLLMVQKLLNLKQKILKL